MAVTSCACCGGIQFVDDTPYTIARAYDCPEGQEVYWLCHFMWFNYEGPQGF